jgi:spoIIIJ-associated protein
MLKLLTKQFTAKSVEEAIESALKELEVASEEMSYNIIQDSNKGFIFGFGSKPAIIEASTNEKYVINRVESFIKEIMKEMNVDVSLSVKIFGKTIVIFLEGDGLGKVIGKHGRTLGALQHLIMIYVNRMTDTKIDVKLDIGEYRKNRRKKIEEIADSAAKKVINSLETVELAPMFSFERKTVHEYIRKTYPDLKTISVGYEPYRKIVVSLSKD